jgi:4-oxalocrotonate tautomerase
MTGDAKRGPRSIHPTQEESTMPLIEIKLFEGRSQSVKQQLVEALTAESCRVLGVGPASVDIILTEVKKSDWATAGRFWSDPHADAAPPTPGTTA